MDGADAELTEDHLRAIIVSLREQLKGEPSLIGPQGPPGKDVVIDYDQLAVEVMRRLEPITVNTRADDGTIVDSVDVKLGQTLNLNHAYESRHMRAVRGTVE